MHRAAIPFVNRKQLEKNLAEIAERVGPNWLFFDDAFSRNWRYQLNLMYSGSDSGATASLFRVRSCAPDLLDLHSPYALRFSAFFSAVYRACGVIKNPGSSPYTQAFTVWRHQCPYDVLAVTNRLCASEIVSENSTSKLESLPFEIELAGSKIRGKSFFEFCSAWSSNWGESRMELEIQAPSGNNMLAALTQFLWILFPKLSQQALKEQAWTQDDLPELLRLFGYYGGSLRPFITPEGFILCSTAAPFWLKLPRVPRFKMGNGRATRGIGDLGSRPFKLYQADRTGRSEQPRIVGLWAN
jgi:hypothetical protein